MSFINIESDQDCFSSFTKEEVTSVVNPSSDLIIVPNHSGFEYTELAQYLRYLTHMYVPTVILVTLKYGYILQKGGCYQTYPYHQANPNTMLIGLIEA